MNNDIDYASGFSGTLIELMAAHNITQKDLAVSLGFTPAEVSNYVHGKRIPGSINLLKLAWFFSVSMEYLLTGED